MIINTNGVNVDGSIKPELIIITEIGAVITATNDVHIIEVTATSETVVINLPDYGTWTVTGVVGDAMTVKTVEVDTVKQYSLEMLSQLINYTMVYDYGVESELSGEWINPEKTSYGSFVKNTDNIYRAGTNAGGTMTITHNNFIDLSDITSVYTLCKVNTSIRLGTYSSTTWQYHPFHGTDAVYTDSATYSADTTVLHKHDLTSAEKTSRKVCVGFSGNSGKHGSMYAVFLVKADDYATLCVRAGLTTPSSLSELISDTNSIKTILQNRNAVSYMVANCTGDFMASFMKSADCLTLLDASPYKSLIQANEHWAKFLAMVA